MILKSPHAYIWAFALLAFWPSVIIHSVRVGNDLLLYALYSAGLFYILLWLSNKTKVSLLMISGICAAAILTKSNGFILLGLFGLAFLLKNRSQLLKVRNYPRWLLAFSPIILALVFLVIRKLTGPAATAPWPVENVAGMSPLLMVPNNPQEYLIFDFNTFFTHAFISPWDASSGSLYYWNYLFKTMLFGEFDLGVLATYASYTLQILFPVFLLAALTGAFKVIRSGFKSIREHKFSSSQLPQIFILLNGVLLIGFSILARILSPYVTTGDFRYILPFLVSFVFLIFSAAEAPATHYKLLRFLAVLTLIVMLASEFAVLAV